MINASEVGEKKSHKTGGEIRDFCHKLEKKGIEDSISKNRKEGDTFVGGMDKAEDTRKGMSANMENLNYCNRGLMNKESGSWNGRSSKGAKNRIDNIAPTQQYKDNYDKIEWSTTKNKRIENMNLSKS